MTQPRDNNKRWSGLLTATVSVILVALVVSMASFVLMRLTPGSSATAIAKKRAHAGATPAQIEELVAVLGLDDPLVVQYGRWLGQAVQGKFGVSERSGLAIRHEITRRIWPTAQIVLPALILAVVAGLTAGVIGAITRHPILRLAARGAGLISVSIPAFWLGYLLILLFSERLAWLPTSGVQAGKSLVMPVLVLATPATGVISRVCAVSVLDALRQPFVTTAMARGASNRSILINDIGRYVLGPVVSAIGLQLAAMMAGTVVVETLFGRPGLGSFFLEAVSLRDLPAVQAVVVLYAMGFVLINRSTDAVVAAFDPRIRASEVGW